MNPCTVELEQSDKALNRVLFLKKNKFHEENFSKISLDLKPKPFVKWVGGKRQLISQFKSLGVFPPKNFKVLKNIYFEPFVGGGAVFFDFLPQKAVISDLNRELIVTYNVIKNKVDILIESLKKHDLSKEYFLTMRAKKVSDLTDIEIASRFIFLNRTCFNGLFRVNKKGEFNVPYGKYKNPLICDEINLQRVSIAVQNVEIKHADFKNVLNNADSGDFIYFDPPYFPLNKTSSFTSYTSQSFLEKEQIELRDTFEKLHNRGCFVMLSNSDTPFINEIYSQNRNFRILEVKAGRMINSNVQGRGKISELVITNY